MSHYTTIQAATFDEVPLASVLMVRIVRRAATSASAGDSDAFVTSVQPAPVQIEAELRTRDLAMAEALAIGTQGVLAFTTASAQPSLPGREIALAGAVLSAVELTYEQTAMGVATLRFIAEAADGSTDPFAGQEAQS